MIKTITKIGNSHGIIFDHALLDLAHLKPGDKVNITVGAEGTIVMEPLGREITPEAARSAARDIIGQNKELFHRLSQ